MQKLCGLTKAIDRTVGEQWQRDKMRIAVFAKHGYKTIIVWEREFRNSPDKTIERVKKELVDLGYQNEAT